MIRPAHPFAFILLLILTGCAAGRHGATTVDFKGYLVPVDSRPGTIRLQIEQDYDSTIDAFVSGKGKPDYIFVVTGRQVKLIYLETREVATFTRPFMSCISKVSVETELTPDITIRLEQLAQAAFVNLDP